MGAENNGGFQTYEAPKQAGTKRNDGGFAIYQPGAAAVGNNGGFKNYTPDVTAAPAPQPLRAATASDPAEPLVLRSLSVPPGAKASLRRRLELAFATIAGFGLDLFDALLTESPSAAPAISAPAPGPVISAAAPGAGQGHESYGFYLHDDEGAIIVSAITGDSPAARAGLQVGDQIIAVDDGIKPNSLAHFAQVWERGAKWSSYKMQVRRNGARLPIEIPDNAKVSAQA